MILNLFWIVIGFIFLIKGADYLVDGASKIAKVFQISEIVIGLTIISIGTSMPEFIISFVSSLNGYSDMAIGNIIGSNISNLFLILGVCAIIKPLEFKEQTVKLEIPLVIFLTALLYIFGNDKNNIITMEEGIILITLCILFIIYNIYMTKKVNKNFGDKNNANEKIMIKDLIRIIFGIISLKLGGDFVVENASQIASNLGVTEKMISLTIVALSTSLPELITSVNATLKGEKDMAIGNIIGSNIFNIVLIIGVTAFINPILYSTSYNKEIIIFMIGMIFLAIIPFIGEKNKISRLCGVGYVISYFYYITSLIYVNII